MVIGCENVQFLCGEDLYVHTCFRGIAGVFGILDSGL